MPHSAAEKEAIGLCIAVEAIRDMANHSILQMLGPDEPLGDAEVRFKSMEHQQLFLVRLLDFVDEKGKGALTGVDGSCLDVLQAACTTRSFDVGDSVRPLKRAVDEFKNWLSAKRPLKLWLPTLDIEAKLKVPRRAFLYIAGNQSKHNLARLTVVSRKVADLLHEHGHDVELGLVPLALDDFKEHLREGYFVYYATWIVEYLTRLDWGIHHYLNPTFRQAYNQPLGDDPRYTYTFPSSINEDIARRWFWRLMNHVRREPYIVPFHAPSHLKEEARRGGG